MLLSLVDRRAKSVRDTEADAEAGAEEVKEPDIKAGWLPIG